MADTAELGEVGGEPEGNPCGHDENTHCTCDCALALNKAVNRRAP